MIEIKCTEEQKRMIISTINTVDACRLLDINKDCDLADDCDDCIERNIKWDIQPEPLKPCPCCGGNAEYSEILGECNSVYCTQCHLSTKNYKTKKQAAEIWNRRTAS